jgi:hypothetical protein
MPTVSDNLWLDNAKAAVIGGWWGEIATQLSAVGEPEASGDN